MGLDMDTHPLRYSLWSLYPTKLTVVPLANYTFGEITCSLHTTCFSRKYIWSKGIYKCIFKGHYLFRINMEGQLNGGQRSWWMELIHPKTQKCNEYLFPKCHKDDWKTKDKRGRYLQHKWQTKHCLHYRNKDKGRGN
jgi:hypothetical protein